MPTLFEKLNLKQITSIVVLDAPASFEPALEALTGVTIARRVPAKGTVAFGMAFCQTQAQVDAATQALTARAADDAVLWFVYPKQSSKRYRCEFNRDTGWAALGAAGYEPVRQVAIDEDWSALRFRQVGHIASMTRDASRATSAEGKARVTGARSATKKRPAR